MEKNQDPPADAAELRCRAEERLKHRRPAGGGPWTELETTRLVHELQVHQIELEMQNEEIKASRADVEARQALYIELYDFAPTGYLTLDREGVIRLVNLTGALLLGVERSQLVKRRFGQFVADSNRRAFSDFLEKVFASEAKEWCEVTLSQEGSKPLVVRIEGTRSADEQECRAVMTDITARKQEAEEASRMVTVVRDSNDAVLIKDFEGRISAWNRGAELMYGYSEAEALQMNIRHLTPPGKVEELNEFTRRLLAGDAITSFETQRVAKDSRILDVWMTVTKLVDKAGKPIGIATTERDITARKRAVEELHKVNAELEQRVLERTGKLEAAKMELEAFSYSVSHDLRAPLRAIDGFSRIVLEEYAAPLADEGKAYLKLVRENTRQMGQLIDDLLVFSRLIRLGLTKQTIDPGKIVRRCLEEMRTEQEGRQLEIVIGDLPSCQADPTLLKQVWTNLLSNALKYTRKQKAARIEIGCRTQPRSLTDGHASHPSEPGTETVYFVKDNGAGFDMKYVNKLFGVFQRLHRAADYEGTGVGLAIVQRIIGRHGGRVWGEAQVNQGATFSFTLE